jgi:hypothetical protein
MDFQEIVFPRGSVNKGDGVLEAVVRLGWNDRILGDLSSLSIEE